MGAKATNPKNRIFDKGVQSPPTPCSIGPDYISTFIYLIPTKNIVHVI